MGDGLGRVSLKIPPADALAYKRMIKYWVQSDTYSATPPGPPANVWLNEILGDTNLASRAELVRHYQFPHMDRVVHLRPGFGLGLALSSSRIANFESINTENLHGWYTGEGLTYLYNGDLSQFGDNFWITVNPYRLPGTTVDTHLRANGSGASYRGAFNWVGGAALGLYGAAGMQLDAWSSTLVGEKSWFMFDDEIVCLGAGISSTDNRPIETIVENRKLTSAGNNVFTADGTARPGTLGWAETLSNLSWAHLAGNTTGAAIGYYFPQAATLKGLREARTGAWSDIDGWYGSTNRVTRNYFTLWFDHGANPANAAYTYVLLPNRTATQVAAYAAHPAILVLENSPRAQGVKETTLGLTAINFWNDGTNSLGGVTVAAAQNERLRREVQALRRDLGAIELAARDELGLVKPGEVVFQIEEAR